MTIDDNKKLYILNLKKDIKNYLIRDASLFSSRIKNSKRDKILNSFMKSKISFVNNIISASDNDSSTAPTKNEMSSMSDQIQEKELIKPANESTLESSTEVKNQEVNNNDKEKINHSEKIVKIIISPEIDNTESKKEFSKLKLKVEFCTRCELSKSRTNSVFGAGNGNTRLVCIGEAPGEAEDKQGLPFVGKSGQLLTKMLSAIDIDREEIFITNVIKCRPPLNRDPNDDEIQKCSLYLDEQLQFLKPRYILALGRIAAKRLLGLDYPMKKFREQIQNYKGIPVIVTYHPSALLRNPNWKRPSWEDLQKLQKLLK